MSKWTLIKREEMEKIMRLSYGLATSKRARQKPQGDFGLHQTRERKLWMTHYEIWSWPRIYERERKTQYLLMLCFHHIHKKLLQLDSTSLQNIMEVN